MCGVLTHIRPQMPAADAFGVVGFAHLDGDALQLRVLGLVRTLRQGQDPGGGGDEGKAQLVAQAAQGRGQLGGGVEVDLRVQGGADEAPLARRFQGFGDREPHRQDLVPKGAIEGVAGVQGQEPRVPLGQEDRGLPLTRQVAPDLVGGKAEDGRQPAVHGLGDVVHGGLAGAPGPAVGRGGVLAVLDDVQVEAAQVHHAEVVDLLVDEVELVVPVGGDDFLLELVGAIHDPAVQFEHVRPRDLVDRWIEAIEVGEQEAGGIADAPVGVGGALEDLVGDAHLAAIVGGRDPEADDVGAQGLHHVLGTHHVALGLGHLLALGIDGEAVGEDAPVGGTVVHGHRGQQGRLEPAAVLVRALQVEVRRGSQALALFQAAGVGDARVEPDVQGVLDLVVMSRLGDTDQVRGLQLEPGLDALALHLPRHRLNQLRRARMQGAGLLVDQQGDGHAPGALARDAPVRAVAHHGLDAGTAPVRGPGDALDLAQGGVPQALPLHADEPLGGGAEDDGGLVAPAMGITVGEAGRLDQGAPGLEGVHDLLVGAEDMFTGEEGGVGQEAAVAAHGVLHPQAVAVADQIIIQAMAGGGVDGAGAGLQGDMLPEDDGHLPVVEGVLELQALEGVAPAIGDDPVAVDAPAVQVVAHQALGEDEALAASVALGLDEDVFQLGVEGHGLVGGQGPGGGGPDDHGQGAVAAPIGYRVTAGEEGLLVEDREADVDGDGLLVGVFHLGLRQGGTAVDAPVHRLVALLDMAVGQDHAQGADDVGLEVEVHG